MWLVLLPSSHTMELEEKTRTRVVGLVARRFAIFTHVLLTILIITGLLLAFVWFLPSPGSLFSTYTGRVLLVKMIIVVLMITVTYGNNIYHGRRMMSYAREGKLEELGKLRRRSHFFSYLSLALMLVITILGVVLAD